MTDNKMKVIIPPETLAQMEADFDAEELQGVLNMIQQLAENGELIAQSQLVDMDELKESDPELYKQLTDRLQQIDDDDSFDDTRTLN